MLAACGDDLHRLLNRPLLLVAYDSMRRQSELISLRIEDIEWLPENKASVLLHKSKTDQHGSGKWMGKDRYRVEVCRKSPSIFNSKVA